MSLRTLVVCPGRGSYHRGSLNSLADRSPKARALIATCDGWRRAVERPTATALDAAEAFRSSLHVAGENASILTFACGLADWVELSDRFRVVGVVGNSMGFYTALAVSGALSPTQATRLVDTMGTYQERNVIGGQLLYPITGPEWFRDPARQAVVERALGAARAAGFGAWWSIDLGSYAVLGADEGGLRHLMDTLPPEERGNRTFPMRLPLHSAFHTPLMEGASARARRDLSDLAFEAPDIPLIDGRGTVHRPRWTDPEALREYTLGDQVVDVFDLTTSVRTALRHTGAEVVVVLGPGNSLGGPLAAILVQEGWSGVRSRDALDARGSSNPLLLSFGVDDQRALLR